MAASPIHSSTDANRGGLGNDPGVFGEEPLNKCEHCGGKLVKEEANYPHEARIYCFACGREEGQRKGEDDMGEGVKECKKCKLPKGLSEFSKNVSTPDGLERWCKSCKNDAQRERAKKGRRVDRTLTENNPEIKATKATKVDRAPTISLDADLIRAIKRSVAKEINDLIQRTYVDG